MAPAIDHPPAVNQTLMDQNLFNFEQARRSKNRRI
jgi:hypothetical protein